ncbi:MAG: hypothetical protein CMA03_02120 [Euryarchaeota archaeon]|nr:hypothetical protein [Euryarchaeota archaeon]|tara:strand:+ start:830 stop:1627 length:798 start_codon:yes stop_codon:yes gene_type:complete
MNKKFMETVFFKPWSIWKPIWNFQSRTNPIFLPIIAFIISSTIITSFYALTNYFAEWRDFSIFDSSTVIDDKIPFIKNSIFIYATYYLLFIAVALSAPLNKKGLLECIFMYQILLVLSILSFIIFVLMPIKVDTREGLEIGNGIISSLYEILYLADPPFNSWPSLHVMHSIFLSWILIRWLNLNQGLLKMPKMLNKSLLFKNRIFPFFIWVLAILISLSTTTTKQHYFFDVITGVLFAALGIKVMMLCIKKIENNEKMCFEKLES